MSDRISLRGIPLDNLTQLTARQRFRQLLQTDGCGLIVTPNSEILLNAEKDAELLAALKVADLAVPDGIGVFLAAKKAGTPLKQRFAGIDFCFDALKVCALQGVSVFFLGGKDGVAQTAAEKLAEKIPGLKTAGFAGGYFAPEEEAALVQNINASGAGFIVAGLGSPKQETFLARHKGEFAAKACIGVGGSLDVWSGRLKRAPEVMTKLGLEWLYRLAQEPSRIGRVAKIPGYVFKASKSGDHNNW